MYWTHGQTDRQTDRQTDIIYSHTDSTCTYATIFKIQISPCKQKSLSNVLDFECQNQIIRQTDRQTGRQAGRETDTQTDRRTERRTDKQTDRRTDRQKDRQVGST